MYLCLAQKQEQESKAITKMPTPKPSSSAEATSNESESMAQAMMLADQITVPLTLHAAVELGLLDLISGPDPLTAAQVAAKLPAKANPSAASMVERLLRQLAAFSVVSCSLETVAGETRRVYGLTPVGRHFVKDHDGVGVTMTPLFSLICDKVYVDSCYRIKDAVLEGGVAFEKAHGMSLYEYAAIDPRFNEVFNRAMSNLTTRLMKEVVQSYNGFESIDRLVDVGGGLGQSLKIILTKYPNIMGICFDLPHVTKQGTALPGMEHIAGDMFEDVPSADAVFLKSILHNWGDEMCLKLLKNCHKAIPENGKVIVVEPIISEEPETSDLAKSLSNMDVYMMAQTAGGKERTKKEFLALAMAAGFAGIRFACRVNTSWIMEIYK